MSISSRTFFFDADDTLFFMTAGEHAKLFKDPEAHPVMRFAGMRVRTVEVLVEVLARAPTAVLSMNCYFTVFDEHGVLIWEDLVERFVRRPRSAAGSTTPTSAAQPQPDASPWHWEPSAEQALLIAEAALGSGTAQRL
jgi:hypothetical protein